MSKILKGLNEANPHHYDSDWDYQDAVAKSGKSRSSYRSQEDDTSDADIAYSKKMYQLSQKQKRDADHDRLATGTNEDDSNQTRMRMNDYYDLADAIQEKLRHAIQMGDKARIQELNKQRDELDAHVKKHGMIPESVDEDVSRRGFLKGMGAAAVAGAAGSAMGQYQLPNVDKVDRQKMIINVDGQEYPLVILSPTDLRPRGGRLLHITCAELGERCLGRYDAVLAHGRVFVLPGTKPIERPKEVDEEKIKGADGKACWPGYRYNGTTDDKDSCVKVKESSILQGIKKV